LILLLSPAAQGFALCPEGVLVISTGSIRRGGIGHHPGVRPGRDNAILTEPTPSHAKCLKTHRLPPRQPRRRLSGFGCILIPVIVRDAVLGDVSSHKTANQLQNIFRCNLSQLEMKIEKSLHLYSQGADKYCHLLL